MPVYFFHSMYSHKLQTKRRYIAAYKDKQLTTEVIQSLKTPNHPTLKKISEDSGIPYGTIKHWHQQLLADEDYIPGQGIGQHRRIFTANEEAMVADMIKTQYIQHHIIIKRKHLRRILFSAWQSLSPNTRSNTTDKSFMSSQFLKGFCKRNGLSFRQMRKKKRCEVKESEIDEYTNHLCEVFKKYGLHRIANMDETPWNFVYKRGSVLAIKGKEEVDAQLPDDHRKSFTVLLSVQSQQKEGKCHQFFLHKAKLKHVIVNLME